MKDFEEWFAEVRRLAQGVGIDTYEINRHGIMLDAYDAGKTPKEALHAQYPASSPDYNPNLYSDYLPAGSRWEHTNGNVYRVIMVTNRYSTDYHRYPPMVVYQGSNGHIWSRQAADWDRSMTKIEPTRWQRFLEYLTNGGL